MNVTKVHNEARKTHDRGTQSEKDQLAVSLFGGVSLHIAGHKIELRNRKAEALVGYLALSPGPSETRERLAGLLWSEMEESRARGSLRQVLMILRSVLTDHGFNGLATSRMDVSLDAAAVELDVRAALLSVDAERPSDIFFERTRIADTLLAGYDTVDQAFYSWLMGQRQSLQQRLVRGLEDQLANVTANTRQTKRLAEALMQIDPPHEGACQRVMQCYVDDGDIAGALAAYKRLWDLLGDEYGMEPSDKTQELVAAIKSGTYRPAVLAKEPLTAIAAGVGDASLPAISGSPSSRQAPASTRVLQSRQAAVIFMDVVGYIRLFALDQVGTLARWRSLRDEVIGTTVLRYGGRTVKVDADAILVEFASAAAALECAVDLQRATKSRSDALPPHQRMYLGAGVHLGDVADDEGRLVGGAVTIAARLQDLSDPCGIIVSAAALEATPDKLRAGFGDLGAVPLNDVPEPVHALRWTEFSALSSTPSFTVPLLPPADRPSIAVLPFRNLGANSTEDYFAQGLVEDIVISLAGLRELFVISRASTIPYIGATENIEAIGRALGVRYVLTGTVRRSGDRLRVSVVLCDAESGATLWAETTNTALDELFDVQDQIVERVVAGIAPNVHTAELERSLRKRPESFTAYDYTLQALHLIFHLDKERFYRSREYLQKAIEADPEYAMPFAWAARWHSLCFGQGWSEDIAADTSAALRFAATAIQLEPNNALGLATYGHLQAFLRRDHECARLYIDRALIASPSSPLAWALGSITSSYVGLGAEAIERATHALRLSPFDRSSFYLHGVLGLAYYVNGDYDEAAKWTRISTIENGRFTANLRFLAASLAAAGQHEAARAVTGNLLAIEPAFTLERYRSDRLVFKDQTLRELHLDHLRIAGLAR